MIGLRGTSTLALNSILLMSGAITTDDMHTWIRQDSMCVSGHLCVSATVCFSHIGGYIGQMSEARTSCS